MSVRDLEARLAGSVEDKVLQRLGYREIDVRLPSGLLVTPRPICYEVSEAEKNRSLSSQVLLDLQNESRPTTIYHLEIPRTYTAQEIRDDGVYTLTIDNEGTLETYPLSILRKDSRWVILLGVQRREMGVMSWS